MLLHLSRARGWGLIRPRYRLSASLELSSEELRAIYQHRIDRLEIFHDPIREQLIARAEQADKRARALPWFPPTEQMPAVIGKEWLETARYIALTARAIGAFRITVGDLVKGITISHHNLGMIVEIEQALIDCVDALNARIAAGIAFDDEREDIVAPGEDDKTTPPPAWPVRRA